MKLSLRTLAAILVALSVSGCAHSSSPGDHGAGAATAPVTGGDALATLKAGNERFVSGRPLAPATDAETLRVAAEKGQHPFATVLTCSDSRIPVERVFDRGFGEIFVVRVAGNVTSPHETGSVEFSLYKLHVPLLVVMGHTKCGAVQAACAGARVTPNIDSFITSIEPAVQRVRNENPGISSDQLEKLAIQENVRQTLRDLYATSPLIREKVSTGAIQVAGAVIDVSNGRVEWFADVPKPDAK